LNGDPKLGRTGLEIVIPTKVHGRIRPGLNGAGLSRKAIMGEIATGKIYLSVTDNPSVLPARSPS
jgi:hypothetical protein